MDLLYLLRSMLEPVDLSLCAAILFAAGFGLLLSLVVCLFKEPEQKGKGGCL